MVKLKKVKKSRAKSKKKAKSKPSIDFKNIAKSFNSLDPQNVGSWPVVVKIVLALGVVALIFALTLLVPVRGKISDIKAAETEQQTLLETYREKESKARNLEEYKNQVRQMEAVFSELLDQLPKDTKIPDLVEDINMRGVGSGVQFEQISVDEEVSKELFIEQPIVINAQGDYHEFGNFVSGIASLSRIITMDDFEITNSAKDYKEIPVLNMRLNAKTYRSKEVNIEQAEGGNNE